MTRPKTAYGRQGLGWDHWKGSFWGFLTVPLRAFGAQLGLDRPCKVSKRASVFNHHSHSNPGHTLLISSQTSSSNLWAYSLCGLPVFELTVQGGLSFLTGLDDLKLRRLAKAPHKSKWDHTRSHRGKVLEWSIIYCNSEIIFPTDMFGFLTCLLRISFQNCYLFVSHLLHCFLSKSSWSILTKIW